MLSSLSALSRLLFGSASPKGRNESEDIAEDSSIARSPNPVENENKDAEFSAEVTPQSGRNVISPSESKRDPHKVKLMLVGDPNCGKLQIFNRLKNLPYDETPTEGDLLRSGIHIEPMAENHGFEGELEIWVNRTSDPKAHKKKINYNPADYRNIDILMVVYDITNRESFENCQSWLEEFSRDNPDAERFLVGAKADLEDQRQVTPEEALEFAKKNNMESLVISSKKDSIAGPFFKNFLKQGDEESKMAARKETTQEAPSQPAITSVRFSTYPRLINQVNPTVVPESKKALSRPPADWKESATIGAIFGAGTAAVGVSILVGALSVSTLGMGLLIGCGVFFLACMVKAISDYRAKKSYLANQGLYHIKQEQQVGNNPAASSPPLPVMVTRPAPAASSP